jgi:exo-1,4-beta-D-glucosaminidase
MTASRWLLLSGMAAGVLFAGSETFGATVPPTKQLLHDHWTLQSSCSVKATGEQISTPGFLVEGWHRAQVPTTVVAALVADQTLPDPTYGMNLRSYPGMTYPIGENFSNLPMSPDSPYYCSWWYRTEFRLPADARGKITWLHFDGINYRANIWLNGQKIAGAQDIAGTFRTFEFAITQLVRAGKSNALAVEVFAPTENDLAIT